MFDIASGRLAWVPVKWKTLRSAGDEPAQYVEHEVELKFDLLDRDEFKSLGKAPEDGSEPPSEIEQFKKLVKGWRGIVSNGSPVPFEDQYITRLLQEPGFSDGLNEAYFSAWAAVLELRTKNSDGSGESGLAAPEQAQ